MPESIESFVKKLQSEGVEAGRDAAEKIKKDASREVEKILADAKADAAKIVAKAESVAERRLTRAQNELELAVRDAVLKLSESLSFVLSIMLARRVEEKLSEPNYIGEIMREVIIAYATADAGPAPRIEINISKKMRDKLTDSSIENLFRTIQNGRDNLALISTFSKAGFEYKINGATVEVSPDSISELLSEMVNPDLQEIIADVVGKMGKKSSDEKHTSESSWKDDSSPGQIQGARNHCKRQETTA